MALFISVLQMFLVSSRARGCFPYYLIRSAGSGQILEGIGRAEQPFRVDAEAASFFKRAADFFKFPVLGFVFRSDFPQGLQCGAVQRAYRSIVSRIVFHTFRVDYTTIMRGGRLPGE